MASETAPKTTGAGGATVSQNWRVRSAAGGQRPAVSGPAGRGVCLLPGAVRATPSAAAPIARCGRYGTTSGSPAHCASSAAVTGPSPNPALSASAARRALSALPRDRSCTQAVAAPNTTPEHSPASARPAVISASSWPPMTSSSVATGDSAANGSTTARRPNRSEAGPPASRPGMSAAA